MEYQWSLSANLMAAKVKSVRLTWTRRYHHYFSGRFQVTEQALTLRLIRLSLHEAGIELVLAN